MAITQLGLFDAEAAATFKREQKRAEVDAFVLSVLGPSEFKRHKVKQAKITAAIEEACRTPLPPEIAAVLEQIREEVKASTRPYLAAEYTLLGLEHGVTKREIKNAYRRKARKLHPDIGGDAEAMKQLNAAYKRLLAAAKE